MSVLTVVAFLSACITIVVGTLAIRRYFVPERRAQILSPPPPRSENGGRELTVYGTVPRRRRQAIYWIAVQPSDCRAQDLWWPQRQELTFERDGSWSLQGVTLGREHSDGGAADIDKDFTIGLFEVPAAAKSKFVNDTPITRPPDCSILHAIDVRRVRY